MHRFDILIFILASIIYSTVAPSPNRSIGDNLEWVIERPSHDSSQSDSNEIPNMDNPESTMVSTIGDKIDNGDQGDIDFSTTNKPINFRKRRSINSIEEQTKSSSNSQEVEGSGENYAVATNSVKERTNSVSSSETVFNISHNKVISNETTASASKESLTSNETGSGEGPVSNPETVEDQQIAELQNKVEVWQKAVDNYLSAGQRRRKRRQAAWPQLFSSNTYTSTSTKTSSGSMSTFASGVSDAVGEALKPAMDLMTQGVDLLSDLYSAKLTKSFDATALAVPNNDTMPADQFRNQLKQLQGKLGDLGHQLQRVVGTFQQLQIPFLDNLMSGGLFPLGAPPLASDDNKVKARQYKQGV